MKNNPKNAVKRNLSAKPWMKPGWLILAIAVVGVLILSGLYQVPFIHERASYYVEDIKAKLFYLFNPPSQAVFDPSQKNLLNTLVAQTIQAVSPTATPTLMQPIAQVATNTPEPSPTATVTPIPLPSSARLEGMPFEYQTFNNCGPDNLAMLVSYWGWPTKQSETQAKLRTHKDDRNVMLSEMLNYVQAETDLQGIIRFGGSVEMLKSMVSSGFPVLLERGHTDPKNGWMGHYSIITGYDDASQKVFIPDTLLGDMTMTYDELLLDWAHFDGMYMVIYPPYREQEVLSLLGNQADLAVNLQTALDQVTTRIGQLQGRELFFAWYSRGSILVEMQDYLSASQAYDEAFTIYGQLDPGERPWRMTWYQVGPYPAYYFSGRYQDTLNLAEQTLDNSNLDSLPETWYWAGKAAAALGQTEQAKNYFNNALEWYPNWALVLAELSALGVNP